VQWIEGSNIFLGDQDREAFVDIITWKINLKSSIPIFKRGGFSWLLGLHLWRT